MQSAATFKSLYQQHYGFVWATVCRFGVAPMQAEDAVHDTFIVAYRRREAFDGQSPKSWLYSIGRRVASNYRRSRGRREARHASAADFVPEPRDVESRVSAKVALDQFLESLSTDDRELFVLSELDGLTGPELAATLGRKLPTVYGRVRVLRQRFAEAVTRNEDAVREAQRERPSAKASGWLLLQPWIAASTATGGSTLILGTLGVAAAAALLTTAVVASQESPPPAETTSVLAASTEPRAPTPQAAAVPVVVPAPPPAPATPALAAPVVPPSPRRPVPRRAPSKPEPEPAYDLAADTTLLRSANQAVRDGQSARALDLLAEHERRFPTPAQPDLRTAVWIGALCAEDRPADAQRRAAALRRARPNSPMLPRIALTCAAEKNTTAP